MTRPTAKEIKRDGRAAGVPVDVEVAARIANSIGPAFDGFAAIAGTLPFDLEPSTFTLCKPTRPPDEHRAGLDVVDGGRQAHRGQARFLARSDAILPRPDRGWQPHLNAFMAIEANEALKAADAADAALAKGGRRGPLHGVPLAHKDMYYEAGKLVTCGSRIRRDFVATTTRPRCSA